MAIKTPISKDKRAENPTFYLKGGGSIDDSRTLFRIRHGNQDSDLKRQKGRKSHFLSQGRRLHRRFQNTLPDPSWQSRLRSQKTKGPKIPLFISRAAAP